MTNESSAIALSQDDLVLLKNALNEVLNGPEAIPDWEFQTRLGVDCAGAAELLSRIGPHLKSKVG